MYWLLFQVPPGPGPQTTNLSSSSWKRPSWSCQEEPRSTTCTSLNGKTILSRQGYQPGTIWGCGLSTATVICNYSTFCILTYILVGTLFPPKGFERPCLYFFPQEPNHCSMENRLRRPCAGLHSLLGEEVPWLPQWNQHHWTLKSLTER